MNVNIIEAISYIVAFTVVSIFIVKIIDSISFDFEFRDNNKKSM